jgi:hypothetical protein
MRLEEGGCGIGICGRRLELRSCNVFDGLDYAFERVVLVL